jgi:hypothetical protein
MNRHLNNNLYAMVDTSLASNEPISLKYPLYSAVIPGLGQYKLYNETEVPNHKARALCFLGLEVLSWGTNLAYRKQHNNQKVLYKKFANNNWDFANWISGYDDFYGTPYENVWMDSNDSYTQIGESSHFVQFWYDGEIKRTTDNDFLDIYSVLLEDIENDLDIYGQHSISIIKDQHFYENIGKYNEFFSGWVDADTTNIIIEITNQNYTIALSPQKNNYIDSYERAEHFSNISEYALSCIYFNHFISMLDAFILARKFGGKVMLNSSTVYDGKQPLNPIGVKINLRIKL